jgi:hypothetical protein
MTTAPKGELGQLSKNGDQFVVHFERTLRHPREKVWRAITESEHLEHWLPCDIVGPREAGAEIELPFWPAHVQAYGLEETPSLDGRIDVWDPPAVFEWWWSTEKLRFELHDIPADQGGGTLLRFTTWLSPDGGGAIKTSAGYHVCLDALVELLDTGTTTEPLVAVDTSALEASYEAELGRL